MSTTTTEYQVSLGYRRGSETEDDNRMNIESMALALCEHVWKAGGSAWAGWELYRPAVTVRAQGVPLDDLSKMTAAFAESCVLKGGTVTLSEKHVPETPLPEIIDGRYPWGTVLHEKLTRQLLDQLADGCWVESYVYENSKAVLTAQIAPTDPPGGLAVPEEDTRDGIWRRARQSGAAGKKCVVTWDVGYRYPTAPPEE